MRASSGMAGPCAALTSFSKAALVPGRKLPPGASLGGSGSPQPALPLPPTPAHLAVQLGISKRAEAGCNQTLADSEAAYSQLEGEFSATEAAKGALRFLRRLFRV